MPAITTPIEAGKLMARIDSYEKPVVRYALKLSALTFVRPGELRHAEWTEVDIQNKEWRIPAEKMKMKRPHIVPLSRQAIGIIEKLRKITGNGKYLFPSTKTGTRPMSDMTVNVALRTLGYESGEMTGHGFRAMASSLLAEQGWSVDAMKDSLRMLRKIKSERLTTGRNILKNVSE